MSQLKANGQVFLVNPFGVLFGQGAKVDVGGLIASTLNISNKDFESGTYVFQNQGSGVQGGAIVNRGRIRVGDNEGGGFVALLGGEVRNQGTIAAHLGSVALAAGKKISLDFAGDGLLKVQVNASVLNALVENQKESTIHADGGAVLLTAHASNELLKSVVNNQGTIQARTVGQRKGKIQLLGGGGNVNVAGTLDASAPQDNGGFIETRGDQVNISTDIQVTTQAAQGSPGTWRIVANGASISGPDSSIDAVALGRNLAKTNVAVVATGTGDIDVRAPINWSANTLKLAGKNIKVGAVMTAEGSAGLEMNYGGYSANNQNAAKDIGVHMALLHGGFAGRVDFTGKNAQGASTNQLKINGNNYTILTALGSEGSMTGQDLQGMNGNLAGNYALAADIDASATAGWSGGFKPVMAPPKILWDPNTGTLTGTFTGTFEGLGHAVQSLSINRRNEDYVGLFGVTKNAMLRNVGLVEASVVGKSCVGALVGSNFGHEHGTARISNAYATGAVKGENYVGGLVGSTAGAKYGKASIFHASATGAVTGKNAVGGLVGGSYGVEHGTASISYASAMGGG